MKEETYLQKLLDNGEKLVASSINGFDFAFTETEKQNLIIFGSRLDSFCYKNSAREGVKMKCGGLFIFGFSLYFFIFFVLRHVRSCADMSIHTKRAPIPGLKSRLQYEL